MGRYGLGLPSIRQVGVKGVVARFASTRPPTPLRSWPTPLHLLSVFVRSASTSALPIQGTSDSNTVRRGVITMASTRRFGIIGRPPKPRRTTSITLSADDLRALARLL